MRYFSRVPKIDWMGRTRVMAVISAILIFGSFAAVLARGLNFGIDFTGGYLVEVNYPESVNLEEVRTELNEGGFDDALVQFFGTSQDILIRLAPRGEGAEASTVSDEVLTVLRAGTPEIELRRIEFVGPQVGEDLALDGTLALMFAVIGILIYVSFRFEWKFSLGAVLALLHDAVVVVGYFALFGIEFDLTVLAAILAVIGYSLNDSIVVFDRIRENFLGTRGGTPAQTINLSINQMLARTINTGTTTLVVLFALLFLGGETIAGFATALIVGITVGTYSSIFVASALVMWLGAKREDLMPPQETEIDEMP